MESHYAIAIRLAKNYFPFPYGQPYRLVNQVQYDYLFGALGYDVAFTQIHEQLRYFLKHGSFNEASSWYYTLVANTFLKYSKENDYLDLASSAKMLRSKYDPFGEEIKNIEIVEERDEAILKARQFAINEAKMSKGMKNAKYNIAVAQETYRWAVMLFPFPFDLKGLLNEEVKKEHPFGYFGSVSSSDSLLQRSLTKMILEENWNNASVFYTTLVMNGIREYAKKKEITIFVSAKELRGHVDAFGELL